MEKLRNIKTAEQYPVLFIDHNNYQEIFEYKERIRVYAMENPKTEIILRYPLFNMVERLDFQNLQFRRQENVYIVIRDYK